LSSTISELFDCSADRRPAYPGIPGYAPNLTEARGEATMIARRFPDRSGWAPRRALVFLLYQKGRDSRIFQAQDRAIDDFT